MKRVFTKPLPESGSQLNLFASRTLDETAERIPIREEANMATLPITRTSNSDKRSDIYTEWTAPGRDGESHDFYRHVYTRSGNPLPGPGDDRVLLALYALIPYRMNESYEVRTHYNELRRLAGLPAGGSANRMIDQAIDRLDDIAIKTNSFWQHHRNSYADESTIEIIQSHHKTEEQQTIHIDVKWGTDFINYMSRWSMSIDLPTLISLSSPIARRLMRTSQLAFYESGQLVEDLQTLCHVNLGIKSTRTAPSMLKQSLRRPIRQIHDQGLAQITIDADSTMPSGYRIVVTPGQKMQRMDMSVDDPQHWALQMYLRGLFNLKDHPLQACRELVDEHPIARVRRVIRAYDIRREGTRDLRSVSSPGWMKEALDLEFDFDTYEPNESERYISKKTSAMSIEGANRHRPDVGAHSAPEADEAVGVVYDYIQMNEDVDHHALTEAAKAEIRKRQSSSSSIVKQESGPFYEAVLREHMVNLYLQDHEDASHPTFVQKRIDVLMDES